VDQGWVTPRYEGLSITNLPATIAALLSSDLPGALPPLPENLWNEWLPGLRRVVLVIFDALGYRLLQRGWAQGEGKPFADIAQAGRIEPLTSVFPSTTDAALMSLTSGRPPAEHGWLAYHMYLRELGVAANAILLCPMWSHQPDLLLQWGLRPEELIPVPSLAQHLTQAGITTRALLAKPFKNSTFTQILYRGVGQVWTHHHASDFWVQLRHLLADTRGERAFLTAYWGGLDTLGHTYGPDTDIWDAELRTVSHLLASEFLDALPAQDRDGTLLVLTADHGQMRIPEEQILNADRDPGLSRHLLVPIVGESRAAFVYPRPGHAAALRHHLETTYPDWFAILDSGAALEAGLMGHPIADESYARSGELLVLPKGSRALQHRAPPLDLVGRHGGLTQDEMLVPLIGARLEALS
jgi:predicted AlkP superfamily pyrophosphatase or phosphodiesterase